MNVHAATSPTGDVEARVSELLSRMTLDEKIGQMAQANVGDHVVEGLPDYLADAVRTGRLGSVINSVQVDVINALQRIAVEESRLGIPLIVGRDVIHGFKTVMPIPLGQAASFNPEVVRQGAAVAAREASRAGVHWTFAPMIDISRDPRWGRIAESLGEDPFLASQLGAAMVQGFQGDDLAAKGTIAATAKHFAGYGAAESGRDYATTNVPRNEMLNVYLPPFKAAVDAGVSTLMTSFSDIDGVPATASEFLLRDVLRDDWDFDGFVVSDWDSIRQLSIHGLTADDRGSAVEAIRAGVDMEMHGDAYLNNLKALIENGVIDEALIDEAAANILRIKFRLGLFERPYTDPEDYAPYGNEDAFAVAKQAAVESAVLLKNDHHVLPLNTQSVNSVAVIGPLANAPYEQLGTWIFDGDSSLSVTPVDAIRSLVGSDVEVHHVPALAYSRDKSRDGFDAALAATRAADVVVLFLGEEAVLSGEAHSRADINLPGIQQELVATIREAGKPVVAVIMAGRPLTLSNIIDDVDAILYAWHPGTMGGPALADLLFGVASPSGKLPASFPRMVGQIPVHYNQKNTGKPPSPDSVVLIDDIDPHAPQLSTGMTAYHLDAGYTPLFPFGHGLSYTDFDYRDIAVSSEGMPLDGNVTISVTLENDGDRRGTEVVQLYVRDLVGNVTRPVKELKGFQRITLDPGEIVQVEFTLDADDLAFYGRNNRRMTEPGEFHAWIGGSSATTLRTGFRIVDGG
ncbi:MAG: glycoside hydrolase family 3 N-terminal domain-containing protein [Pseudomonadota bacterium]